ncbi:putative T-complex protein 10A homolog isoform X2 [Macaca nemestrina]|uniref:putative T-complex protein 10A homolog isoform X2 n=1 Tax=Macaca nemestrina TaxID=9545 RepID=UPI0039B98969
MPKHICHKSQSAIVLRQRSSSNSLTPSKPMSLKTERISLGKTPPQEDREKGPPGRHQDGNPTPTGRPTSGAERRGVSEDGKVMHPSSRSPQNSSGRKSPVQASQAATLQEQTAAAGGADRSSSVLESSEGRFLSHVEADELTGSSPNIEELQNLPVNPPPSLETAQAMDTKMKKEEIQEEKRHPNGKADGSRWSGFPESISRSSACRSLQTGHGALTWRPDISSIVDCQFISSK